LIGTRTTDFDDADVHGVSGEPSQLAQRTSLLEPLSIHVKRDRSGLGSFDEQTLVAAKRHKTELRQREQERESIDTFKQRQQQRFQEAHTQALLRKSLAVCRQLDLQANDERFVSPFYYSDEEIRERNALSVAAEQFDSIGLRNREQPLVPVVVVGALVEREEFIKQHPATLTRLNRLIDYLRTLYHYCIFCAIKYNNEHDLAQNCPGPNESDHEEDVGEHDGNKDFD
jgi:hypothetical protein